jgi:hypothetical protein
MAGNCRRQVHAPAPIHPRLCPSVIRPGAANAIEDGRRADPAGRPDARTS